jgi:hypothetical protein
MRRLRRVISARSALVSPSRSPASTWAWRIHLRRLSRLIPRSRAVSVSVLPGVVATRTASALNPAGYAGSFGIGDSHRALAAPTLRVVHQSGSTPHRPVRLLLTTMLMLPPIRFRLLLNRRPAIHLRRLLWCPRGTPGFRATRPRRLTGSQNPSSPSHGPRLRHPA